jgi:2'-5' RNA ligase
MERNTYSLWIVPGGEAGEQLQSVVDELATAYDAPSFVPHITVVAGIEAGRADLAAEQQKIAELAKCIGRFSITLGQCGYTGEEFRCLYRFAEAPELADIYAKAREVYPQVAGQHFAAMPHVSLLYGTGERFSSEAKANTVRRLDLKNLTFEADSLDLYTTNAPIESWNRVESFPLSPPSQ